MCDLPNNEEALHTAQMQLMPSRQALNELMLWMDGVEATINEDEGKTVVSLMDVQLLLQKYRVNISLAHNLEKIVLGTDYEHKCNRRAF